MRRIERTLQVQIEGLLLAAIGALVLIACAAPARPQAVIIAEGSRFAPATLSGRVGERVVWRNRSPDRHSIVVEPAPGDGPAPRRVPEGAALHSGDLFHNEGWSHTFDRPGVYRFACAIHGDEDMVGVLTVTE